MVLPSLTGALKAGGLLSAGVAGLSPCVPAGVCWEGRGAAGPKAALRLPHPSEGVLITWLNAYAFSGVIRHESTSAPRSVV